MYIELDFIVRPFAIVFFICWFAFSLLIVLKPRSWINFQNRVSKHYGYEWVVTDENKFLNTHRRAGILLIIFGMVFATVLLVGLIRI